jgi:AcrR family transcriptional regulator
MQVPLTDRPLRKDAERNRTRIVDSAREAFAEVGIDAPMEEVARRAGVGVGTVYRRFPTKEDLIDAVFEEALRDLVAIANEALREPDPWQGFRVYLERTMELNAANRGLKDILGSREHGRDRLNAVRDRLRPLLRRLIAGAQAQGSLRADFAPTDLQLIYMATGRVMEATKDVAPDAWRRLLGLVLDGLQASAATPLPRAPLSDGQLIHARVGRAGKGAA